MKKMIPKFRAYSVEENIMYYPDDDKNVEWTIDDDTGFIAPLINLENGMWRMIDKYVLMQSTGLKDKNGVEIFESDLVKVIDGESEEDSYISVVKNYSNEGYPAFDIEYPPNYHYDRNVLSAIMCNGFETIEVTGNVYDNPELLEVAE
ncbi:TPA: YopX family protein [Enterococcus faecalis]